MSRFVSIYIVALISCLGVASSGVSAEETSTNRLEIDPVRSSSSAKLGTSSFGIEHSDYISNGQTYYRPGAKPDRESLVLNLGEEKQWGAFKGVMQIRDEFSQSENWNYFDPLQLYVQTKPSERLSLSFGRKLYPWTEWEGAWRQGLFQPRYLEDRLNPLTAGLSGAFVDLQNGHTSFTLALLPAFLPDFGSHTYVQEHAFASANPWFHPPASQFRFRGATGEIHYSLRSPSSESVLEHPGLASKIEYHQGPYFTRLSYAYKPIPQMLLDFPSRNRVQVASGEDFMSLEIHTRILYHRVANWDNVVQAGNWRLAASVTNETPDRDFGRDDYTTQQVVPAWIYTASVSHSLEEEGPSAARVTIGALKVIGGDAPDRGDFASSTTLFERRYQYLEAYMIEFSKPWRGLPHWMPNSIDSSVRALYDRLQNGGVFTVSSAIHLNRDWRATLSVDILGLTGDNAEVTDGFLSTYRANDSVNLGVSYVF